jgi:hypothetical protein
MDITKIKELVLFMKSEGVIKFKVDGFEVEFNMITQNGAPQTIDDAADRKEQLLKTLKSTLETEQEDLLWST